MNYSMVNYPHTTFLGRWTGGPTSNSVEDYPQMCFRGCHSSAGQSRVSSAKFGQTWPADTVSLYFKHVAQVSECLRLDGSAADLPRFSHCRHRGAGRASIALQGVPSGRGSCGRRGSSMVRPCATMS